MQAKRLSIRHQHLKAEQETQNQRRISDAKERDAAKEEEAAAARVEREAASTALTEVCVVARIGWSLTQTFTFGISCLLLWPNSVGLCGAKGRRRAAGSDPPATPTHPSCF